jgi:hypothetical protein
LLSFLSPLLKSNLCFMKLITSRVWLHSSIRSARSIGDLRFGIPGNFHVSPLKLAGRRRPWDVVPLPPAESAASHSIVWALACAACHGRRLPPYPPLPPSPPEGLSWTSYSPPPRICGRRHRAVRAIAPFRLLHSRARGAVALRLPTRWVTELFVIYQWCCRLLYIVRNWNENSVVIGNE